MLKSLLLVYIIWKWCCNYLSVHQKLTDIRQYVIHIGSIAIGESHEQNVIINAVVVVECGYLKTIETYRCMCITSSPFEHYSGFF